MSGFLRAHLHLPGSRPFFTQGELLKCVFVDTELCVVRIHERPFLNYEFNAGDLVLIDSDDFGNWHIVGRAPTA